jgi:hypothetical protein
MLRTWSAAVQNSQRRDRSIQDFITALGTGVPATGFRATGSPG